MTVLYQDQHITVCIKPISISSEDTTPPENGMPGLLRAAWGDPAAYVGVVHRLDVGVSGVMVYARTPGAAAALSAQVADRRFEKEYRCVCLGTPDPAQGQMRDFLFKDSRSRKVFPVKSGRKGAKEALLDYELLARADLEPAAGQPAVPVSLCRVVLHTGRTHQIRVQFASRKHPLLGDGKYGSRVKCPIALQCARIAFDHPKTGRRVEYRTEMPAHFPWHCFAPQP